MQVSYKSYWIRAILEVLHAGRGSMMSIQDVSNVTGIHPADVREAMGTLQLTQCAPASLSRRSIANTSSHQPHCLPVMAWARALPAAQGVMSRVMQVKQPPHSGHCTALHAGSM